MDSDSRGWAQALGPVRMTSCSRIFLERANCACSDEGRETVDDDMCFNKIVYRHTLAIYSKPSFWITRTCSKGFCAPNSPNFNPFDFYMFGA